MTEKSKSIQRAPFNQELLGLRTLFTELLPVLEIKPGWYGSVFFERRASRTCSANLKQTQINDQVAQGVVLRIYDGYTLYERATDDLDPEKLKACAQEFAARVEKNPRTAQGSRRPYLPPTWKERLAVKLEDEVRSQIPADAGPSMPIHFGIRYSKNPTDESLSTCMEKLKGILARCQQSATRNGFNPNELTYIHARQGFSNEESLFVDRQTNMSQTLFRVSLTVVTMSGADRTFLRKGGLGGLECTSVTETDLDELITDLKLLKNAQKLAPGKYRVLFGPVVTGVLAHEAFGHAQEGDTCARGRSKAWELHKTKEKVGNEHATILNNPAVFDNCGDGYAAWGSYFFDEEGWLAQEQVLLDRGVLCSPMTNLTSALRLGVPRTANGKRETWSNGVYTRQTNTYFSPGKKTFDELLSQIPDGFLAEHPAGGMEDPKGMGIQVGISYLHEVKKGKLTGRVFKGPAGGDIQMTGYTPDVLNSIIDKSKIDAKTTTADRSRFPFNDAGGCGKYHKEFVYAGCGGTYLLMDQVTLG